MDESFIDRFRDYTDEKLMNMLLHEGEYTSEAIAAATFLLKKRNKLGDAEQLLLGKIEGLEQADWERKSVAEEQLQRFRPIDFNNHLSFFTGSSDQIEFENELLKAGIPYQTAEVFSSSRPLIKYYLPKDFDYEAWLYDNEAQEETEEEQEEEVEDERLPSSTNNILYWALGILFLTAIIVLVGTYLSMPN